MADDGTILTTCESCGRDFRAEIVTEPTEDGGERTYFVCPWESCGRGYGVAIITAEGIRLRERLQRSLPLARRGRRTWAYIELLKKRLAEEVTQG